MSVSRDLPDAALLAEVRRVAEYNETPSDTYAGRLLTDLATRYASLLASQAALREAVERLPDEIEDLDSGERGDWGRGEIHGLRSAADHVRRALEGP